MPDAGSSAVINLGGATLKGLVADRQVLEYLMPTYPGWATTQAVEASVTLYFLVLPNGQVRENVQVQKTAGFQDFDTNAVTAIGGGFWALLPGDSDADGRITPVDAQIVSNQLGTSGYLQADHTLDGLVDEAD